MITPIGKIAPEISSDSGMPYSISLWIIRCCGSSAQPVLRIIWRLVRYVVAIMIRTRTPAMILTVVPFAPSAASSSAVEPNFAGDRGGEQLGVRGARRTARRSSRRGSCLLVVRVEPAQHVEQAEEDRDLQEHRKAAHQRVGLLLPVELHHLFLERLPVTLVLLLQLLDLGLERLHRPLRPDLLDEDREQDRPGP